LIKFILPESAAIADSSTLFLLIVKTRFSPFCFPPLVCFVFFSCFLYKKDQFEPPVTAENWSLGSLVFSLFVRNTFYLLFVFCQSNRNQQVLLMNHSIRQPKKGIKNPLVPISRQDDACFKIDLKVIVVHHRRGCKACHIKEKN